MSTPTPFWPCPHNCHLWARGINPNEPMTNHHPRCEHVDASLIDVWEVVIPGEEHGCIMESEADARAMAGEDPNAPLEARPRKMHREVYENLPEFAGF